MSQDENDKLRLISWVFPLVVVIVSASELSILPLKEYYEYYLGKLFFALAVSSLCLSLLKFRSEFITILIGIFAFGYCSFSQLYRPLYYIGFVQATCFYPLFVPVKQKNFLIALGTSSVVFIFAFLYSFEINPGSFYSISKSDVITTVITTAILGIALNKTLDKYRIFYGESLERFSIIGEVSTAIAHNVKGMISSPLFDIEVLQKKLNEKGEYDLAEKLSDIYKNIENSEKVLKDMNYISHVAHEYNEWVPLSEVIENISRILNIRNKNVKVLGPEGVLVFTDRRHLEALLVSLMLNSLKGFSDSQSIDNYIQISNVGSTLCFRDNGNGFSHEILASLNKGKYLPHRNFSGLGLTLVRRLVQRMEGHLTFSNENGAKIEIKLPKSRVKRV